MSVGANPTSMTIGEPKVLGSEGEVADKQIGGCFRGCAFPRSQQGEGYIAFIALENSHDWRWNRS